MYTNIENTFYIYMYVYYTTPIQCLKYSRCLKISQCSQLKTVINTCTSIHVLIFETITKVLTCRIKEIVCFLQCLLYYCRFAKKIKYIDIYIIMIICFKLSHCVYNYMYHYMVDFFFLQVYVQVLVLIFFEFIYIFMYF